MHEGMSLTTPASADTTPTGAGNRRLTIVHAIWWVVVAIDVLFFITGVPGLYSLLLQPCSDPTGISCSTAQPPPADFQVLQRNGWVAGEALFNVSVVVLVSLVFFAVGGLIAQRKWREPIGLFVSLVLISFGATGMSDALQVPAVPPLDFFNVLLDPLAIIFVFLQYPALAAFLLTFPNGRFAPRWSWLIIFLWIAQVLVFLTGGVAPIVGDDVGNLVLLFTVMVTWGSTIAVQVYRYARVYTPIERQQTKWVVFSLVVFSIPSQIIGAILPIIWPDLNAPGSLFRLTSILNLALFWLPISLGVGIAILRSKLYDIDLLINRALVYGSLTILLALMYAVGVVGSQAIVGAITRGGDQPQSPVTIVVTTLVIAALFQPLRRRIQAFIDRRFYRTKYNVEVTLAAFGTTLRNEVNLGDLSSHLLGVVDDTMQPAHVSLWLRAVPEGNTNGPLRQPSTNS